ncbi:MAG: hypothetical protein COU07_02670 [Candidatus Harrisonbacteria bacterium CG10_big_fil_rev_8_21_14_0_10_40_38]|uniref:Aminoacyl-tRNA hydrolase n=1 Tax=Candidatus Harrisonbacteria bacterium CG10_big_fil_rev_8_21_14_0_10_40_38 TaxID=1974583 RepID=A0A2H0URR7_9BACT|nr:MAG: hypothetical protein COU07_02670 [Candidatus Harrisonbacteria bacterium CG10_big_fil_rev_8_21_14_0_10_40_38]
MAIKLIIGLGNPEAGFQKTYHNAGHIFVDYVSQNEDLMNLIPKVRVLKTDVSMNISGKFVLSQLSKISVKPEELLIVHDESDVLLGKYKFSFNRGSAGQNGVRSIQKSLGTDAFWRLRIGIRPNEENKPRQKAGSFVLKKISATHMKVLGKVFSEAVMAIPTLQEKK